MDNYGCSFSMMSKHWCTKTWPLCRSRGSLHNHFFFIMHGLQRHWSTGSLLWTAAWFEMLLSALSFAMISQILFTFNLGYMISFSMYLGERERKKRHDSASMFFLTLIIRLWVLSQAYDNFNGVRK